MTNFIFSQILNNLKLEDDFIKNIVVETLLKYKELSIGWHRVFWSHNSDDYTYIYESGWESQFVVFEDPNKCIDYLFEKLKKEEEDEDEDY